MGHRESRDAAKEIAEKTWHEVEKRPLDNILSLVDSNEEVAIAWHDGKSYSTLIRAWYEDPSENTLRVVVSVDWGGLWGSIFPASYGGPITVRE